MTAYIISFNRLTPLQKLCSDLVERGCTPIIVDNSSTYPPLMDWLSERHYDVISVPNTGSRSPWHHNIIKEDYYIVTDPDLDISGCPLDMVSIMQEVLDNDKTIVKCGLSLRIDDLPDNPYANTAKEHEERFWITKAGEHYSAPIDTTIALYSADRMKGIKPHQFYNAVRLSPPYSARHTPWYLTPENLTDEEKYYIGQLTGNIGFWLHEFKRKHGSIS